jgi:iron-sulfur cluster repair protein YtfE (RIC family)
MGELDALRTALPQTALTREQSNDLRRVLYGLHTLLAVHFQKEEEVYLPILDEHLEADEARDMIERMERAAEEARRSPDQAP